MALNTAVMNPTLEKVNSYKENDIVSSTPERLLLMIYDEAIIACKRKDEPQISKVLAFLIDNLDFDYTEVATGLFSLYEYMMRLVKQNQFDEVLPMLTDLRQTWEEAMNNLKSN